jgi:hypothetical protein
MQIGSNYNASHWNQVEATISAMNSTSDQSLRSQANGPTSKDTNTAGAFQIYYAGSGYDTTQKTYIAFRSGESASSVETGYKNVLVELIKP